MPSKKADIRISKTFAALLKAVARLLNDHDFNQITVNDICVEALVSRAAFYTHFNDKYDLLRHAFTALKANMLAHIEDYGDLEKTVNAFIQDKQRAITHLLNDYDAEVSSLVRELIASIFETYIIDKPADRKDGDALTRFCEGGIYNLLLWQVHNRFPEDSPLMSEYIHELLLALITWDAERAD